jgi:hypothetical protein
MYCQKADSKRFCKKKHEEKKTVFRIHDILVWVLIRIRGSMPLTNGSGSPGSGSCYFYH